MFAVTKIFTEFNKTFIKTIGIVYQLNERNKINIYFFFFSYIDVKIYECTKNIIR